MSTAYAHTLGSGIEEYAQLALERLPDRFWVKVNRVPSGCWIWVGAIDNTGYGRFAWEGRPQVAHRVAYKVLVGPIPVDLVLDHLCRNRPCVNPEHLEPVTNAENILRGIGPSAQHAVKTHCPSGHEYTEANTYLYRGTRTCRTCRSVVSSKSKTSRAALAVKADASDPRHGTTTAYVTYGCHCEKCRTAWRAYQQGRRAALADN